jgi:uncharacterized membrane protein YadS
LTINGASIVLVGIRLSVFDASSCFAGLPVVLAAIVTGLLFVTWFNRKLGLPQLGTLIAAKPASAASRPSSRSRRDQR